MSVRAPGIIRNRGGISSPCTQENPPGPAGCGLVTEVGDETVVVIPGTTFTKFMYAYTTGTVSVRMTSTPGDAFFDQFLTAMGYDTVSGTGTSAVRNVGLVAGSFTLRNSAAGRRSGHQIIGLNLQFSPEPGSTAALLAGMGMLAMLAGRRSATSPSGGSHF